MKKVQIITFRNTQNGTEFLLLKSAREKDFWQGVTGKVEDFDESIKEAAIREMQEELNCTIAPDNLHGPHFEFHFETDRKGHEGELTTEYCFSYEAPKDFTFTLSREHETYEWLPFSAAFKRIGFEEPKNLVKYIHDNLIP